MRTIVELEDTENYFRPPCAELNLDLAYNDDAPAFKVYDKKDGVRTEVALNSFKESRQYIIYMTKHRMAINFSRLYATMTSSENEKKKYRDSLGGNRDIVLEQDRPESLAHALT